MLEALIFAALAIGLGLLFVFAGYPLFRILLPIWAFLAGLMFGVHGADALMGGGFLTTSLGIVVGFLIGLVLAAVSYFVYSFAVVLYGAALGYLLGSGIFLALGLDYGFITVVMGVIGAIVFAFLFSWARVPKFIIVLASASSGAMAVITGLFVLFGAVPAAAASLGITRLVVQGSIFWLIAWAVVAGFGMAVQYRMTDEEAWMEAYEFAQEKELEEKKPKSKAKSKSDDDEE